MSNLQLSDVVRQDATYQDVVDSLVDDLPTLAAEVGHLHTIEAECTGHIAARVMAARERIDAANGGKRKVGEGGWRHWVLHNLPFGESEAKRYLKVARALLKGSRVDPSLSLRGMLGAIRQEERDQERQDDDEHEAANDKTLAEIDATEPPGDQTPLSVMGDAPPVIEDDAQATLRPLVADLVACFQAKAGAVQARGEKLLAHAEGSEAKWLQRILGALADAEGYVVELGESC